MNKIECIGSKTLVVIGDMVYLGERPIQLFHKYKPNHLVGEGERR